MPLASAIPIDSAAGPDLGSAPARRGLVRLSFAGGRPYLGRTVNIRRRLQRLLGGDRLGELRAALDAVEYRVTGSELETSWELYRAARNDWPDDYRRRLRLRCPPFVRLLLKPEYPRTTVTTRLPRTRTLYFGPFRARAAAERFEAEILDFFPIRRCVERWEPSPDHPGCIYGEIGKCSRPCQGAVTAAEHRAEAGRLLQALHTDGASLERELAAARDQASEGLEFEEAARLHRRIEEARRTMRLAEPPARDLDRLHGVIVQRAAERNRLLFWPLFKGFLQPPLGLGWDASAARPVSLDAQLRELLSTPALEAGSATEREDHQGLLGRWFFSNRRRGELILFEGWEKPAFRKLVNAASRVARGVDSPPGGGAGANATRSADGPPQQ